MNSLFKLLQSAKPVSTFWRNFHYNKKLLSSHFAEVNGKNIHYELIGNAKASEKVLLIPGALGCGRTDFFPQLKYDWGENIALIAFDPPGYGKSIPPEREWNTHFLHDDADIAANFMKKIGYAHFSIMGWSDGGNTGALIAAKYPEMVRKLILWGSNSYVDENDSKLYQAIHDLDKWSDRMKQPFIDMYGYEKFEKLWHTWVEYVIKYNSDGEKGNIFKYDCKNVKCPTLILHGKKDPIVPQHHPVYIHNNIKGSILEWYPDGKHNIHLRYADEFNKRVKQFLE